MAPFFSFTFYRLFSSSSSLIILFIIVFTNYFRANKKIIRIKWQICTSVCVKLRKRKVNVLQNSHSKSDIHFALLKSHLRTDYFNHLLKIAQIPFTCTMHLYFCEYIFLNIEYDRQKKCKMNRLNRMKAPAIVYIPYSIDSGLGKWATLNQMCIIAQKGRREIWKMNHKFAWWIVCPVSLTACTAVSFEWAELIFSACLVLFKQLNRRPSAQAKKRKKKKEIPL